VPVELLPPPPKKDANEGVEEGCAAVLPDVLGLLAAAVVVVVVVVLLGEGARKRRYTPYAVAAASTPAPTPIAACVCGAGHEWSHRATRGGVRWCMVRVVEVGVGVMSCAAARPCHQDIMPSRRQQGVQG
jgi:hypothetical protein